MAMQSFRIGADGKMVLSDLFTKERLDLDLALMSKLGDPYPGGASEATAAQIAKKAGGDLANYYVLEKAPTNSMDFGGGMAPFGVTGGPGKVHRSGTNMASSPAEMIQQMQSRQAAQMMGNLNQSPAQQVLNARSRMQRTNPPADPSTGK